jgi:3-phenylpropionate/trans-cinnamate dioxygenase ferredoxin subunit
MPKHVVGTVAEIPPGTRKLVEVAGRSIGVFNIGGTFFALRNRCPHQGAALCTGQLGSAVTSQGPGDYEVARSGEILRCPWHGWEFDVRTGQSWFDPAKVRVKSYETAVAPGSALNPPLPGLMPGPYLAETFPVSVEERYVLVEV